MRTLHRMVLGTVRLAAVGLLCTAASPEPSAVATAPAGYHLVWHDEFDGTALDRSHWDFDMGRGFTVPGAPGKPPTVLPGWGNDELECYTDRPENAYVADGSLHIKAIKESFGSGHYTSARLRTGGKDKPALFAHAYGRFEFRAKMPTGQGYWPALWLLPQDESYGGWAASGEIDILEVRGSRPHDVQGTIHYGGSWPKNVWHGQVYTLPNGGTVADWHVYAIDWEPGRLRWSVDGVTYATRDYWWSRTGDKPNAWPAPFDKPFYVVMNLAIGGKFGGNPDGTTTFPHEMQVDYVRVYDRDGGAGAVQPAEAGKESDPSKVDGAGK